MGKVNRIVEAQCGIGVLDLPDAPYREMYDDGLDAEGMADIVLEEVAEHLPF
jgi:hypothetical protein